MTVKELIAFLQTQPQDIQVTHQCCSESCLLDVDYIYVAEGCPPRPDGWVQNKRPDVPPERFLRFPGN